MTVAQLRDSLPRIARIVLIFYWAALLTGTHLPPRHMPSIPVNDKIEHLTAYTGLATLIGLCFRRDHAVARVMILTIVIVMCSGAIDEWTQPMFGRDCELNDWFADSAGAIVGSSIAVAIRMTLGMPHVDQL